MIDLSPDLMKQVTGILEQYVPNAEVWAFGSRVSGAAREYSDLDLVVINEKNTPENILPIARSVSGVRATD